MNQISKKHSIGLLSVGIAIVVGTIFLVGLNFAVNYYIDLQSKTAIVQFAKNYTSYNILEDNIDNVSNEKDTSMFSVYEVQLYNDEESQNFYNIYRTSAEKSLITFVKENKGNIVKFQVLNKTFNQKRIYFSLIEQKNYDGVATYTNEFVLYVDPSSVFYMADLLNIFFIIVMIVSVLGASFLGMKAGKAMENSEQKLRRFFSNASHELKTPLMAIQGYAEGLYTGVAVDTKEASKTILEQSDRMEALVEELLLLSKIESGQLKLHYQNIHLCELLDSVIAANNAITKKKNILVHFDFPDLIPYIYGDEIQLYKAFGSIFSNAVKFTKSEIHVVIRGDDNKASVKISDNGSGIASEDMEHIFQRFYYGKNGSTGIGLSLAQDIIHLHKGKILARNNEGAEFTVILPIVKVIQ